MLLEIRRYTIKPGRRDEFVAWFEEEVVPVMEEAGMRILGTFVGVEDSQTFFYLRGYPSEVERRRQTEMFYRSDVWLTRLRDIAMEMEQDYHVDLVRSTPGSRI